jgi:hypothetical protein
MTVFRCRICTRPALAAIPPSRCPACGAGQQWLPAATAYHPSAIPELAEKLRQDLLGLREALVDNSRFYRAAARVADDEMGRALLHALTLVSGEQAGVVAAMLGEAWPEMAGETGGGCSPAHRENLLEARQRTEQFRQLVQQILDSVPEVRVQEVAEAFAGAGRDHLELLAG